VRLFTVYTTHTDYDEHDPFIVLAEDETQARQLVGAHKDFREDRIARRRASGQEPWGDGHVWGWYFPKDKPSEIVDIKEMGLEKAMVVLAVFNAG